MPRGSRYGGISTTCAGPVEFPESVSTRTIMSIRLGVRGTSATATKTSMEVVTKGSQILAFHHYNQCSIACAPTALRDEAGDTVAKLGAVNNTRALCIVQHACSLLPPA